MAAKWTLLLATTGVLIAAVVPDEVGRDISLCLIRRARRDFIRMVQNELLVASCFSYHAEQGYFYLTVCLSVGLFRKL